MMAPSPPGLFHTSAELRLDLSRSNGVKPFSFNKLLNGSLKAITQEWTPARLRPLSRGLVRLHRVVQVFHILTGLTTSRPVSGSLHIMILNQRMHCAACHWWRLVTDAVGHIIALETEPVPQHMCHWVPAHMW